MGSLRTWQIWFPEWILAPRISEDGFHKVRQSKVTKSDLELLTIKSDQKWKNGCKPTQPLQASGHYHSASDHHCMPGDQQIPESVCIFLTKTQLLCKMYNFGVQSEMFNITSACFSKFPLFKLSFSQYLYGCFGVQGIL